MEQQTVRQWEGGLELVEDCMVHGSSRIEVVHLGIARIPYAVMKQVGPLAGSVGRIEQMQQGITMTVYAAVRAISRVAARAGKRGLAELAQCEERRA